MSTAACSWIDCDERSATPLGPPPASRDGGGTALGRRAGNVCGCGIPHRRDRRCQRRPAHGLTAMNVPRLRWDLHLHPGTAAERRWADGPGMCAAAAYLTGEIVDVNGGLLMD